MPCKYSFSGTCRKTHMLMRNTFDQQDAVSGEPDYL